MEINPLALTDEELDGIYKPIAATGLRGGVWMERRTPHPHEKGKGKSPLLFRVVAPANRASGQRTVAHAATALDAEVIATAFNHLAFLIESFRSLIAETETPRGDSLMVHVPDATRGDLIAALATMPDEAFGWVIGALSSHAGMRGFLQIFPDGLGGFQHDSRASIDAAQAAADALLDPTNPNIVKRGSP